MLEPFEPDQQSSIQRKLVGCLISIAGAVLAFLTLGFGVCTLGDPEYTPAIFRNDQHIFAAMGLAIVLVIVGLRLWKRS